jgi:hypothetical protein
MYFQRVTVPTAREDKDVAFNIRRLPEPGSAESDVSQLHGKLTEWLSVGPGRDARKDERDRIAYVTAQLRAIQDKLYEERETREQAAQEMAKAIRGECAVAPDGTPREERGDRWLDVQRLGRAIRNSPPVIIDVPEVTARAAADTCECDPGKRMYCHATGCLGGADLPDHPARADDTAQAAVADAAPETLTWAEVMAGDTVTDDNGNTWRVVEGISPDWWKVTLDPLSDAVKVSHPLGFSFQPNPQATVQVRRGDIWTAAQALSDAGLDVTTLENGGAR